MCNNKDKENFLIGFLSVIEAQINIMDLLPLDNYPLEKLLENVEEYVNIALQKINNEYERNKNLF